MYAALHGVNIAIALAVIACDGSTIPLVVARVCFIYSLVLAAATLHRNRGNSLFAARTLLLLLPGYYAAGVQLYDSNLFYSYYERAPQSLDISLLMYAATSLAIAGSELGFWLGRVPVTSPRTEEPFVDDFYFFAPVIPILLLSQYIAWMNGETLLTATYASGTGNAGLGSAISFGIILLCVMFVNFRLRPSLQKKLILLGCGGGLLIYGILMRGGRQDVLSCIFSLYVLDSAVRGRPAPVRFGLVVIAIPMIVLFEYFGFIRSHVLSANFDFGLHFREFLEIYLHPGDTVMLSTFSPIASTFSNTIYGIKIGITDFIKGKSYFEFLLRTPPEFLYPDRPRDYAWIFADWNMTSGGGFFELAEAYFNFNWAGTFIVPAIISFIISRAFHAAIIRRTRLAFFILFAILSMLLRGVLYQTFAFFRAAQVSVVIMAGLESLRFFLRRRGLMRVKAVS